MDRRTFIGRVGLTLLAPAFEAAAQSGKMPVVGFLQSGGLRETDSWLQFQQAMRELGYVERKNIILERRGAGGRLETLPNLAAELVRRNVDVLYATGPAAVKAASEATRQIPIVALDLETDPVQSGLVQSLSHPGTNVTGLFLDLPELAGKWLELLKTVAPAPRRIGLLWDLTTGDGQLRAARAAAPRFEIELVVLELRSADDLDAAFNRAVGAGAKAIVMLSSPVVSQNSRRIAESTVRSKLPGISPFRAFADSGGLISYGPNLSAFRRFAASYVDKILKGARPGDLPIQQPTTFELVINMKTARALGLSVPQSLLLRADAVIE